MLVPKMPLRNVLHVVASVMLLLTVLFRVLEKGHKDVVLVDIGVVLLLTAAMLVKEYCSDALPDVAKDVLLLIVVLLALDMLLRGVSHVDVGDALLPTFVLLVNENRRAVGPQKLSCCWSTRNSARRRVAERCRRRAAAHRRDDGLRNAA